METNIYYLYDKQEHKLFVGMYAYFLQTNMAIADGKIVDLRELSPEEPRPSLEESISQTAPVSVGIALRRSPFKRNPEAYVYYEVLIIEPNCSEVDMSPYREAINIDKSKWLRLQSLR